MILERGQLDGYHCNHEVVDLTGVLPLSKIFKSVNFQSTHLKTILSHFEKGHVMTKLEQILSKK